MVHSMRDVLPTPMHPREFRHQHRLSVKQISILTNISYDTLRNWMAHERSDRYVEPGAVVKNFFGLLSFSIQSGVLKLPQL